MTSNLTVADCRTELYEYVTPASSIDAKFLRYLNQVRERVINSGKWKGTTFKVNFDMDDREYITLPYDAEALLGLHVNKNIQGIQSRWYEYLVGGPHDLPTPMPDIGSAIDMGDNYVTTVDIETPGVLRFRTVDAQDATGKTMTIYGDSDDYGTNVVGGSGLRGIPVTLVASNSYVDTTQTFAKVTSIVKPVTEGVVRMYVVNGATETLLAEYAPGETRPQYRRYRLANTTYVVTGLCKLRYVPLVAETEPVIPANIGALKMGILALVYEDANDPTSADAYWVRCYSLLNQQLKENRGMARHVINGSFAAAGLRAIPTTR